uniref:Uncharacterized protein n=1 Tax=Rhizophora mucronata TaxID=61149 RepID=A0A2P2N125_RHIMU
MILAILYNWNFNGAFEYRNCIVILA